MTMADDPAVQDALGEYFDGVEAEGAVALEGDGRAFFTPSRIQKVNVRIIQPFCTRKWGSVFSLRLISGPISDAPKETLLCNAS